MTRATVIERGLGILDAVTAHEEEAGEGRVNRGGRE